ncbi:MAG TPA: amino acid adenylation domain-containing protein, partial [Longimicrobium sp.]|nr:amino acid adenylation domain-containing protein [Longimicrobium sp.]
YILDERMQLQGVGVIGELYLGGLGLSRGYLGRPGLTADRYVPNPFSREPGARMYRTGDRIRWNAEGNLEYLGRFDHQVKIRGFRVELGEIESALRKYPGVRDCVVMAREDVPGEKRLAAYLVGGDGDLEALRAHLRQTLPEHFVPAAFVTLDEMPLTPNGKLDRKALPAPDFSAAQEAYEAPRTPAEEVLAGIWAQALGLERVGVTDNVFTLGAESLMATRVASSIRQAFGVELTVRAMFEARTVAELAERVESARRADRPALPPIVPLPRDGEAPLSFGQERLWYLDRVEPGKAAYNVAAVARLSGALDVPALERAVGEIQRRHEALRTVFRERDGGAVQAIAPFTGLTLPVEDLSALGADEAEAEAQRRVDAEAALPFDLATGPLFRPRLLRLADGEHVLMMSMHHALSDGWSMDVLYRELSEIYTAFVEGRESPLAEPALQYADYAAWQQAHVRGPWLEEGVAWWKERLAGAPALLELPTDHPRPAVQTYVGARETIAFPLELAERLETLARREGGSLYMVLLAAFQTLLGRYAGMDDVVVASPIAGRTRGEVQDVIGFFTNTLVLRTDLSGDPRFGELLRRVREVTLSAYEHQEVPLEQVVRAVHPGRSLAHAPVFQVMFVLQTGGAGPELPGISARISETHPGTAKLDLTLSITREADGLSGYLEYGTDLFEAATVQRMVGHLRTLLEQVSTDADLPLSRVQLLDDAERALVVGEWNRTDAAYPSESTIHQLFQAQVERTPDAAAVVFNGETLTYAQLDARANRLANHLRRMGVRPEVRVAVCLEPGAEMIVSVLAVLKAGGAYVPLDPASPVERLRMMLADSGVAAVLTQDSLRGTLPVPDGVRVLSVDGAAAEIAAESADRPESGAGPRTLAYVIYTSGSTGTPKGAGVEHRSACNLIPELVRVLALEPGSRSLLLAPLHFDASVAEIFSALAAGAALYLPDATEAVPGPEMLALLRREGITHTKFTPSALSALPAAELPALATLVVGGEACTAELVERWGAGRRFVNVYGPTEATVRVTAAVCAPGEGTPPIGRPLANTRLYVLDAAGEPAPVGVPGELYIGGVQLARGYLGRAAMTAERFIPDPFAMEAGGRLYRTGDRVRWLADGTLEYQGRLDAQVKIRGYRIELGEVDATLRRHAAVRDCAVVAREDAPGDRRLVAYVVGDADAEALRAHLRRSLPEYMVPAAFVAVDVLPLTANGKLDRRALPAPEYAAQEHYVAPRTPTEEVLAGIWAQLLGREQVGIHDDFFQLGGHSLLATRLVWRMGDVFGTEVSVRAVLEAPTIAQLAERVEAARKADAPRLAPIVRVERTEAMPLSFAQERLWFLDQLQQGNTSYNVPASLRLSGALDADALERALAEVVRRHEVLRSTLRGRNGSAVQVISPFRGFALPVEDLSSLDADAREAEVRRRVAGEMERPFDLAAGPLVRATLLRLADEEHVLLMTMHHAVTDGWSMGVLYRELGALYAAFAAGRESPLAEPVVQYADYAAWQREQLSGEALEREVGWWKSRLAGAPALLELPTDRPRPAVQRHRGAYEPVELTAEVLAPLQALARAEGATLYMVLLAAFQVLLGRYAGSEDVVVGSPIAGRTRPEVEELIGFFVNTLVLRTDLSGDPAFREVLRRVRTTTLGAYEHQEVPFERLVEELQPERSLSHTPLFQVMFTMGAAAAPPRMAELRADHVDVEVGTAKFDLSFALLGDAQGLSGVMQYSTDLFDAATIQRMIGHLRRVLQQVSAAADVPLSRMRLLDDAERQVVTGEWNRTDAAYPSESTIHALFQAQAERTPDAPAVVFGGETLSYAQLDARANRLANHLRRMGVRPEVRVAVCLEPGAEMIVSVLGVLKAGGAYVPMDPASPVERLRMMLVDSGVAAVLTQDGLRGTLPVPAGVRVLSVDGAAAEIGAESAERPASGAGPRTLAYVIYTSGSTGTPKGAGVEHRSACNLVPELVRILGLEPGSRSLLLAPLHFDASVAEIFSALAAGAALYLPDAAEAVPGPEMLALLRREGITHTKFTPSALSALPAAELPALATLVVGGEACTA